MTGLAVAIVGAGPAGLFTLDALLRQAPEVRVDVYERLPTPFGLIRHGVAPDHQGTKAVVRQFDRAFGRPNVRLIADCDVGPAVPLELLREAYDLVFLATGAPVGRRLGVSGEDLPGVYGGAAFMAWLNGHPDYRGLEPQVGEQVVVVGGGNVALDVTRVLAKTEAEMASSDLCAHARRITGVARSITVVVRSPPEKARFTSSELAALGRLKTASVAIELPATADLSVPAVAALAALSGGPPSAATSIRFRFALQPIQVLGSGRVEQVRLQGPGGVEENVAADTLILAIGQAASPAPPRERTCAVGWAAGGRGDIPGARAEAADSVRRMLAGATVAPREAARARLNAWLEASGADLLDWAAWRRIDAAERAAAVPPRPREKLASWESLRRVARLYETV
ncbi:FAD-dependent oxidoreductase [Phenylobacterium sp. J367]|uniref:FAD-dependent oxidoreductase n=1 Tax=Phenylobacterium sp. J367 TaxID=2898435 RepID=UPI00215164C5|nr:FAD-dependent oxidoreductase [Phenylobacterium sp. J367]MCR5879628.1 FAD-dependent oxidoreductase [Phenylobacterium sp. J367]